MAINPRVHVMRETVVRLTQMLAGKGVQVTQRGISAFVRPDAQGRPVQVNLPYMPDNATDELMDAVQGFMDHEVAHILFTDFKAAQKMDVDGSAKFWNLLEDTRIEREMAKRFRGSGENLARTGKFFLDKYVTPRLQKALKEGNNEAVQANLITPMVRAMSGQMVFQDFMKDYDHLMTDIYDRIKDLEPQIVGLSSTAETATLSAEMVKRLRDGVTPPPPPVPGKEEDEEEDDEEEGDDEAKGLSAGDKSDEDEDGEEGGAAGEGVDDDEGGEVDKGARNDESKEFGELIEADGKDEDGEETVREGVIDTSESSALSWEAIEKELANDYDDSVSASISEGAVEAAKDSEYLIYSKDSDVIEIMKVGSGFSSKMLTNMQDEVDGMVGPLQKDLERAIAARSLSRYSPGHRSGRLHAANLSRLTLGDPRVFRRKEYATTKDVAVELVIDISGSMGGSKIHTAAKTAYALASVLDRIGIKNEVICFTTGEAIADWSTLQTEATKIGREYSRYEALYMPILKGFDERMTIEVRNRFAWLPHASILRNNVDGESIEVAGRRLAMRREEGKVMMVLSDGAPHAAGATRTLEPHLKRVIASLTKTNMKVVGIGIESDDVRRYYPKSLVLHNVNELPTVVLKELRSLLLD